MSERRRAPDNVIVEISGIHVNGNGRTIAVNNGRMMAFLCPECSDVHLIFQFDGISEQFNMSLPAEAAERLSALLVAPQIIE